MALKPFSKEELNFFKFASIVCDEFPKMLRSTFVKLWNSKIAPLPGYKVWDDSPAVRTLLLALEGGTTVIPTNDSYKDWDCTALFKATIYSKTFAISTTTTIKTLRDQFLRGKKPSPFHASLISPTGNQDETITLAIDQVRLLRNTFCHLPKLSMTKPVFDNYTELAKDAFTAVGFLKDQIDYISCLKQSEFPTERVDELKREIRSIEQAHIKFVEETLMTTMEDRWETQMFFNEYFSQNFEYISQNLEEIKKCFKDNQTTETECSAIVQRNHEFASLGSHRPELDCDGGVIVFRITVEMAREVKDKALDIISLVEILYSCEQIKPSAFHEALKKGFGDKTDDQKFGEIKPTCLLVPLYCLSDERFLKVLDDFESGKLKERLLEEFSQLGDKIEMMEIELMRMEEVNKTKEVLKRKLQDSTTHFKENRNLEAMGEEEFAKMFNEKVLIADGNDKNIDGVALLHTAVIEGSLEIVKYLVEHGIDVNGKNTNGWTVLHVAIHTRALKIVKYLVEQGADITPKSKIGSHTLGIDILKMAILENSVVLVNLLLEKNIALWRAGMFLLKGRETSLLEWSIHLGHDEIASILKKSEKHREQIQILKTMNCNQLGKIEIPVQVFLAGNKFAIGNDTRKSCVYIGLMKDGSEVAIKRTLVQLDDQTVENEIRSLIKTDHSPFIVNYRHFHRDDTFMYLIVDLCEEDLIEFVDSCSIEHLQVQGPRMIKEILSGLEFLHGKRMLHRDLKPSNVLVDIEGRMKLADFGISRVLNDDETTVQTFAKGTPAWMPPEVIEAIQRGEKGHFKKESDVHVAGMIAFFILTKGEHPFGSSLDGMRNILEGTPVNLKKLGDRKARKFVSWLINHRINDRPYAHEALRNSFVNRD